MNRRLILAGLATTGGLMTTAFLQVAFAAADVSATGADAFTIGSYTFDPFTVGTGGADVEGFAPLDTLTGAPPLTELSGGTPLGLIELAPQSFEVFNASGADLGNIGTSETVTGLLSLINAEFTVEDVTPLGSATDTDLPAVGSVYDALNLGGGIENIYTDIPGTAGGAATVTDTLVTPFGNVNLDSLFDSIDAAAPLKAGDAFTGLLQSGDSSIGPDAFTIGGTTFDPTLATGGEGFDPVTPLAGAPPLLELGGVAANLGGVLPLGTQDFNIYNLAGTEVGSIDTNEAVTGLLGSTNTEFAVTSVDPLAGDAGSSALPTVGSVYDVFNITSGLENVYTAIPGVDGAADTVTDTLLTPLGVVDLDALVSSIDAIAPPDPGDAFAAGLDAASAAATSVDPLAFLGL
jgi:hypothetical protein